MIRTSREHYEELDWLDLAQGRCAPARAAELRSHLESCADCRRRLRSLERLSRALPAAAEILAADPDVSNVVEFAPFAESRRQAEEIVREARRRAGDEIDRAARARREVAEIFARPELSPPESVVGLAAAHVVAADANAQELLWTDVAAASARTDWCRAAIDTLRARGSADLPRSGAEARVRITRAYVLTSRGLSREALEELDGAATMLDDFDIDGSEEARWHRMRSIALNQQGRNEEAIEEIRRAEIILGTLEDEAAVASCQVIRAVALSDLGRPEEAVEIYRDLLRRGTAESNPRLVTKVHVNLLTDLVFAGRLTEARAAAARATELIRKTGPDSLLRNVRVSLARIALKEGRLAEALKMFRALAGEARSGGLSWNEVQTELTIAEIQLRLGRSQEAVSVCRDALSRARQLGLPAEATRALAFLGEAEADLDLAKVVRVQEFLRQAERAAGLAWSAA
jgi:tetratricopeptide (TPR) repeat protein